MEINQFLKNKEIKEDISEIRFAPDGSSSGGRISLFSKNKKYIVYVDWLTGRVVIDHE